MLLICQSNEIVSIVVDFIASNIAISSFENAVNRLQQQMYINTLLRVAMT